MKKTVMGILIGIIIVVFGVYLLANGFTDKILEINEVIPSNDSKSYIIYARDHATQLLNVTGEKFDLSLSSPKQGLQIPTTTHNNEIKLSWIHLDNGMSNVTIQNIDNSDLEINAILITNTDVSLLKYFVIIIIIGAGIIGFSVLKTKQSSVNFEKQKE